MSDYAPKTPAPMSNPAGMGKAVQNQGNEYAHPYLQLQRDAGAQTPLPINRSAKMRPWQAKLKVGSAFDPAEAEADNAAREVVSKGSVSGGGGAGKGLIQTKPLVARISRQVQRTEDEEASPKLMRQEEDEAQAKCDTCEGETQRQEEEEARDTQLPKDTASPKLMREEDEEASPKLMRKEDEDATPKLQREEEEEASPRLMREEDEDVSPKLQRQEEEEASPMLQRQEDEEASPKLMRQEDEDASAKLQRQDDEVDAKCADCEEKASREEEEEAMPKQLPNTQTQAQPQQLATNNSQPTTNNSHLNGFTATQETHDLLKSRKGAGEPMPETLKNEMEAGFGADFSNVKIHRDSASTQLNKDLKAKAFTHGEDVFFGQGQFDAGSDQGKELIAHELTHTIQQGAVQEKKPDDKPAESPVVEMARTMQPGTAAAGIEPKPGDQPQTEMGQVEQADMEMPMSDLNPEELDKQAEESAGAEAEAAIDQAAQGEGEGEGEIVPGMETGGIPDVETESEIEMPSVEKQRIAGEISEFKGAQGETEEKGGEVFKFMATETENVCGEAAEATGELAENESEHPAPSEEVAEAEAAEEVPDEFGQQMGNAAQVEGLEKEGQDQEDAQADPAKQAMMDQLEEDTPTNLGELKDYNPKKTAGQVTSVVGGEVAKVKNTFGKIEQKAKPVETPDAQDIKPVPKAKDTAKLALGQGVVPEVPEEMANMDSYQEDMDAVMAEEGISEEQMAMVDSGPLAEAQKGRAELKDKVENAPTEIQEGARQQAKTVEGEMDKEEDTARTEMKNKRKEKLEGVHGEKTKTKSKLEQEREKVTLKIKEMYQATEDKVKTKLGNLEKENEERFAAAVIRFTDEFKTEVDTKVNAFLDERHSGWFGWARAAKDWLLGVDEMPEVKEAFDTAKKNYVAKVDNEIRAIITYNNKVIQDCKEDLKKGKEEIDKYVKTLAPNLRDAGTKAAEEMSKKFAELDEFINEKQKALVDKLCAMKDKAIEHIDKVAEKMKEALSGALSMLIGLVVAALLKFFNWALGLFGYGMDNLEETIVRTKRTLTFMVKHPIDFMSGLFTAVGQGFTQFGDNIQKHLISGLVMWLTGGMREEPIQLPDKWDLKGILFFIMEVLGLGWANLRKKLVKLTSEKTMTMAERMVTIVTKLITEGPIAMWEDLKAQGDEIKNEIFGAVREMMIIEVIKAGVTFLLSMTNPASGIVKAIKAIYDFVMWFFNNISRIIEMVKKIFDSAANIVEGNYGEAANAIERVMGLTIPVIIDLFLSIIGLGGLPKKVMGVIKKVGGKLNSIIDKLLAKVAGVIKKIFGGKKGGGKKGKKDGKEAQEDATAKGKLTPAQKKELKKAERAFEKIKVNHPSGASADEILPKIQAIAAKYKIVKSAGLERKGDSWAIKYTYNPTLTEAGPKVVEKGAYGACKLKGGWNNVKFEEANKRLKGELDYHLYENHGPDKSDDSLKQRLVAQKTEFDSHRASKIARINSSINDRNREIASLTSQVATNSARGENVAKLQGKIARLQADNSQDQNQILFYNSISRRGASSSENGTVWWFLNKESKNLGHMPVMGATRFVNEKMMRASILLAITAHKAKIDTELGPSTTPAGHTYRISKFKLPMSSKGAKFIYGQGFHFSANMSIVKRSPAALKTVFVQLAKEKPRNVRGTWSCTYSIKTAYPDAST